MGSITTHGPAKAVFRFNVPDPAITAEDRAIFALAAPKTVQEIPLPLHDLRTATHLPSGRECLDKHGFTVVSHSMPDTAWADAEVVKSIYMPAVIDLVKSLTGCKTVLVNNVAFRRKPVDGQADPMFYHKRDGDFDKLSRAQPTDRPLIMPPTSRSVEPARGMHVDYTLTGLRAAIRHCRADFRAAGATHLAALDDSVTTTGVRVDNSICERSDASVQAAKAQRIAAYSIWRPLAKVTRDPIAVLDWQSARPERWRRFDYRSTGYEGEFLLEGCAINAPEEKKLGVQGAEEGEEEKEQRWYYVKEQMPDEVMVIKFADSEGMLDEGVAGGCGHGSPAIVGQDGETRESVEARVLAFW